MISLPDKVRSAPSCGICGSLELSLRAGPVLRSGELYHVYFCPACGVGMTWPRPGEATLAQLYAPGEYRAERGRRFIAPIEFLFELHKKWLIRRIGRDMQPGRMLDIGCGSGFLASLFAAAGWDVTGVERDSETAVHARETYGITVITDISDSRGHYDLIMINHVLEHLDEPLKILVECRKLLAARGRLIVAVPNFNSIQAAVGGNGWFHLDLPIHLYHFSDRGLTGVLAKAGFRVIEHSHSDWIQNIYGWLQTLLNRAGIPHNALYELLRMKSGATLGKKPIPALLSLVCCLWAVPASLAGICIERLCRTGGVIRCVAVASMPQEEQ